MNYNQRSLSENQYLWYGLIAIIAVAGLMWIFKRVEGFEDGNGASLCYTKSNSENSAICVEGVEKFDWKYKGASGKLIFKNNVPHTSTSSTIMESSSVSRDQQINNLEKKLKSFIEKLSNKLYPDEFIKTYRAVNNNLVFRLRNTPGINESDLHLPIEGHSNDGIVKIKIRVKPNEYLNISEIKCFKNALNNNLEDIEIKLFNPKLSSTAYGGVAQRGIDGNTSGEWGDSSVIHSNREPIAGAYFEAEASYKDMRELAVISVYNRIGGGGIDRRLNGSKISIVHGSYGEKELVLVKNTGNWTNVKTKHFGKASNTEFKAYGKEK